MLSNVFHFQAPAILSPLTCCGNEDTHSTSDFRSRVITNGVDTVFCEYSQVLYCEGMSHWDAHDRHKGLAIEAVCDISTCAVVRSPCSHGQVTSLGRRT